MRMLEELGVYNLRNEVEGIGLNEPPQRKE